MSVYKQMKEVHMKSRISKDKITSDLMSTLLGSIEKSNFDLIRQGKEVPNERCVKEAKNFQTNITQSMENMKSIYPVFSPELEEKYSKLMKEFETLNQFIPEPVSEEEMKKLTLEAIKVLGATSIKDFGRVLQKIKHMADGRLLDGAFLSKFYKESI